MNRLFISILLLLLGLSVRAQNVLGQWKTVDYKTGPILDIVIINGLEKDGDTWEDGTIFDPETGKVYKCYITLENKNRLKVRGYIGFSLLGRTQYWNRIQE